jgi:hypothetical protein
MYLPYFMILKIWLFLKSGLYLVSILTSFNEDIWHKK